MPDLASAAIGVFAIGAVTGLVAVIRACRRQQGVMADRVDLLERRIASKALAAGEAGKALAPGEGLPVGAAIHGIAPDMPDGRPLLIVFVSSGCPPCTALLSELASWQQRLGTAARVEVMSRDDERGKSIANGFHARWTPAGVLVGSTGRIASAVRYGNDGVRDLVTALTESATNGVVDERLLHRVLGSRLGDTVITVGDLSPAPEFLTADGRHLTADGTIHIFWDPGCQFCQGMSEEMQAIHAEPPAGSPRITFIIPRSPGEASRFDSSSVFDPDSKVAPMFGARGTPAAVLVDRDGRIASTVAIGKDAILSLLAPARAARQSR